MLSKNFSRSEFACRDNCGEDTVDFELMKVLEDLRYHFGKPIAVTSGFRCIHHNRYVGGYYDSQHLKGKAADIVVYDIDPIYVYEYLDRLYSDKYGIGKYDKFTHIDVRPDKARW